MTDIPTLKTERLILRAFKPSDFEPMAEFFADRVSSHYGGPCSRNEAWRKFAVYPGHWALRGYGPWALETRADGVFVGICGPWYPEGWVEPEITWALHPDHHGRGYATEAARRALEAVFEDFSWTTAVSVIAVDNTASAALAVRLGAALEERIDATFGPADLYRHQSPIRRDMQTLNGLSE